MVIKKPELECIQRMAILDPNAFKEFLNYYAPILKDIYKKFGLFDHEAESAAMQTATSIGLSFARRYTEEGIMSFDDALFKTEALKEIQEWWRIYWRNLIGLLEDISGRTLKLDKRTPNMCHIKDFRFIFQNLSMQHRMIMEKYYFQEPFQTTNFQEIGNHLNLPVDLVKQHYKKAMECIASGIRANKVLNKIIT